MHSRIAKFTTIRAGDRRAVHRGWLVVAPIGWCFLLLRSGISSDYVTFSLPAAWGLTFGTLVALAVLKYAVRGWWNVLALPLWFLLLMEIAVLWYWNAK